MNENCYDFERLIPWFLDDELDPEQSVELEAHVASCVACRERLARQGLIATTDDPDDRRRLRVMLTEAGEAKFLETQAQALAVTARTLAPLSPAERRSLMALLSRLT